MKSTYPVRVLSALVLTAAALTAQIVRERDAAPLKNWATPLYWQPTQAEKQAAVAASPKLQFPGPGILSNDALTFVAMTPCRLVDTRLSTTAFPAGFGYPAGIGNPAGQITPSGRTLPLQNFTPAIGPITCSAALPSIAQAYSLNFTVVASAATTGFITAYPTASPNTLPLEATLTWSTYIVSNSAIVPAGINGGSITVVSGGANSGTDLVIDINGYFAAPTDLAGNTALGFQSLQSNTTGVSNTAIGDQALQNTTTGASDTAVGFQAGSANTGSFNTFLGELAGVNNTTGNSNTYVGARAGYYVTTGNYNTFTGQGTGGGSSTTGDSNSLYGYNAGYHNAGESNSFFGRSTGFSSTTGSFNTFLGSQVGYNNGSGSYNTYIGYSAGLNTTGSSNVYLAHPGIASDNGAIRIGSAGSAPGQQNKVFIDTINLRPGVATDSLVSITSNGQLGAILPGAPTQVLLGNLTWGSVTGSGVGVTGNCSPTGSFFLTKWLTSSSVQCSSITELANKYVGIGTTTPSRQLQVNGDIDINGTGTNHYQIAENTVLSIDGVSNLFVGVSAGPNTTGPDTAVGTANVFVGQSAGNANTGGSNNFVGTNAGVNNAGNFNSFYGTGAGGASNTGNNNTFLGNGSGTANTGGSQNTFVGAQAGSHNAAGNNNVFIGVLAGAADGVNAGSNNVVIANQGSGTDFNTILIGTQGTQQNTYIAGIYQVPVTGLPVYVDSTGHLGTNNLSSRLFKEQIADMGDSSSKLFQLRPVNFFYQPKFDDGTHQLQYGLIAEEVAKVYPEMVAYDNEGKMLTVKYQFLAPMLLNELQKQNAQLRSQAQAIQEQQEQNQRLEDRLAALEALLSVRPQAGR